jgi:hypothetical protein
MRIASLLGLCLAGTLSAQSYLYMPATTNTNTTELNSASNVPFMRTSSRVTVFYDATQAGQPTFLAKGISFRHDGPSFHINTTTWVVTNLTIGVGVTSVPQGQFGVYYSQALSQPLTTVFNGGLNFTTDQINTPTQEPWGGNNNEFTFPFATPVPIAIPTNGSFVLDMTLVGNTNNFIANGRLDRHAGTGGIVITDGSSASVGTGCPASATGAAATCLATSANGFGPSASYTVSGANLGANSPVLTIIGFSNTSYLGIPLPFAVPNTTCTLYQSIDFTMPQVANAAGSVVAWTSASMVGIPTDPSLNGGTIYHQNLALVAPFAGNPLGVVLSNGVAVTLGKYTTPDIGLWLMTHVFDATSPIANNSAVGAFALRVEI